MKQPRNGGRVKRNPFRVATPRRPRRVGSLAASVPPLINVPPHYICESRGMEMIVSLKKVIVGEGVKGVAGES